MSNARKLADNLPTEGPLGGRNLIINGGMEVAQRGTSSTVSGYGSVDRWSVLYSGTDEAPTQAQVDVASGTTPYTLGFRKAYKVTNGNQTSGAGAGDYIGIYYYMEGQDLSSSGWNATDPNSKITISYWVKSSVAQTFYATARAYASSQYEYTYSIPLSADTWTKVTETMPGNSNFSSLVNTNSAGFNHVVYLFFGTNYTNNKTLGEWAVKDNANKSPDQTSTWYTTNDATFEITGCQLEVGDKATPFEHEPVGVTLSKCQRYLIDLTPNSGTSPYITGSAAVATSTVAVAHVAFPVQMRATPSLVMTAGNYRIYNGSTHTVTAISINGMSPVGGGINFTVSSGLSTAQAAGVYATSTSVRSLCDAEL